MKISVCMGLYNGEKYIEEQLDSILHQTRRPDEVILCDDGSTDDTVQIVREFLEKKELQGSWKLLRNQVNKGYPENFYYAMGLCTSDVVFLADQDDIWSPDKLEKMAGILEAHPEISCLCCKFGLVDQNGSDIHSMMNPTRNHGTGKLKKVNAEGVFYKTEWPGMVLAYRNSWYRNWSGKQQEHTETMRKIPHDFLLCARAAEEDGFYQMDEELAYHRRHDHNAGGEEHRLRRLLNKQRKMKEINDYLTMLQALEQGEVMQTPEGITALRTKRDSMQGRMSALQSGKRIAVLTNAWKTRKQVRTATVICDILIVKQRVISPDRSS